MEIRVKIEWREGNSESVYNGPIKVETIVKELKGTLPYDILICQVNDKICRLDTELNTDCTVRLFDIRHKTADLCYQISMVFMYENAVHDVLGSEVIVKAENALNQGIYTTLRNTEISDEVVERIAERMRELVDMDLPLNRWQVSRETLIERLSEKTKFRTALEMMEDVPNLDSINVFSIEKEKKPFYTELVLSTGYLKTFALMRYGEGILLRFATPAAPSSLNEMRDEPLLYDAFDERRRWNQLLHIEYASDLNHHVLNGTVLDTVLMSEALHEKQIAEIAAQIASKGKRLILIAGPSSSGKTTFSKRLILQMRICGLQPLYLGTDDYFVERNETPLDAEGKMNFEDLEALDTDLFGKQMNSLLAGEEVDLPEFDFIKGTKVYGKRITSIEKDQPIVIEGIHALNPLLTKDIADNEKFRIYISPLTEVNIDLRNRISTTDARLLRRIVRDSRTRGKDAENTILQWPSVRAGEEKNIFPYNVEADVFFNSECIYELSVLKKYARPQLEKIKPESKAYADAVRLLQFLRFFVEMEDDSIIPNNSILREFIGGGVIV